MAPGPEPGERQMGDGVAGEQGRLEEDEGRRPHRARAAEDRQDEARDERFDEEGEGRREEGDGDEERGLDGGDRRPYSPITAQRKPIMMKKPVNSAIRPIAP